MISISHNPEDPQIHQYPYNSREENKEQGFTTRYMRGKKDRQVYVLITQEENMRLLVYKCINSIFPKEWYTRRNLVNDGVVFQYALYYDFFKEQGEHIETYFESLE